ncbi:MAG: hypothetical protein EBE86_004670 [Hormoscilla sp. GUM202]|nr:hypothetical protein [Hormoscilla sp. GUM202]
MKDSQLLPITCLMPEPRPTVYIETSVISYLTARPSRDLIVAAHQQITHRMVGDSITQL